jgi:hypothetical protein
MYVFVLPGVFPKISIVSDWEDWLNWSGRASSTLKSSLNVTIGNRTGTYYGEWEWVGDTTAPKGRGALNCNDKLFLGFTENGEWSVKKLLIVIYKT